MTFGSPPTSHAPWTLFCPRNGLTPVPGRPKLPVSKARFASAWTLSTPCDDCVMPIAQKMAALPARPYTCAASMIKSAGTPVMSSAHCGVQSLTASLSASKFSVRAVDEILLRQTFFDDDMRHRIEQRHIRARTWTDMDRSKIRQFDLARVDQNQLRAAQTNRLFHLEADDRMRLGGVAARHEQDIREMNIPMELVIAPEPSVVARPATELECQRRAQ
jgi:hypothetical protein